MGFDAVFDYIGQFGLYQFFLFMILGWPSIWTGYQNMAMIFLGPDHDHFCQVNRLENFTYEQQKYIAIPYDEDSTDSYERCEYFDLPYENYTDEQLRNWNRTAMSNGADTIECDAWIYDQSEYISTVVSKWDLVCDQSLLSQLISTIYLMGMLVGAASSGALSDRFGRKNTLLGMSASWLVIGITAAYVNNYVVFVILRLLVAATGHGAYLCGFVIIMEIIGPKYRTIMAVCYQLFFALGFAILPGMAYYVRDFVKLQVVMAAPVIMTASYIILVPESPRWLIAQGRSGEAEKVVRKIAAVNEIDLPDNISKVLTKDQEEVPKGSYADLFRYPNMRKEILIVYLNWFTNNLLYYGFSLNTGTLVGSLYINTLISALVEVPAKLGVLLMLQYWGRRWAVGLSELIAAFASGMVMLLIIIDNPDLSWLLTTFTMLGKMGITASFSGIYVFTAELFPTPVRHLAVGSSSMMARFSGLLAPFMGEPMMKIWAPLPSLVFGLFALIAGLTAFLLPETLGRKMPDTIEDAENIASSQKKTPDVKDSVYISENIGYIPEEDIKDTKLKQEQQHSEHNGNIANRLPHSGNGYISGTDFSGDLTTEL